MTNHPTWQYDEFKQIGTDYASTAEVALYDERMSQLRNIPEECASVLSKLDLSAESSVLEIGTGTGEFAIAAARECNWVCAADVSKVMLEYASQKAAKRGVENITFTHAGFLTYDNEGRMFDAVVTQLALHHLPDFWKAMALRRLWQVLKSGGRLFVRDVVFSFDVDDAVKSLDAWIAGVSKGGERLGRDVERHIRDEYSTFGWAMEGLLKSAGFSITSASYQQGGTFAEYLCRKD